MEIFGENRPVTYTGTVVALGNFDGLHMAHTEIIRRGIQYAREHGLKSGVLLFEEHTEKITEHKNVPLLITNKGKKELLAKEGADFIYIKKFTEEFMKKSPEEFVRLLKEKLHIKAVCVGYDYRFGYKARGDAELLKSLGDKYGFCVLVTDAISLDGRIVSSSCIREFIQNGDVETAQKFLGRYFSVEGIVERGRQNGRKMGVPTANVAYDERMAIPKNGVYAGITYVDNKGMKSVINVGNNPTFNGERITIESHILGFNEDIYGKNIRVTFVSRLRDDMKFSGMDELKKQIYKDIETVKAMNL